MALTRAYEEHEVSSDVRRLFADTRQNFDLPFVPTIFKVTAATPDYLKPMWSDLSDVAGSREFHSASRALQEFARSQAIYGGWRFSDQRKALSGHKFTLEDEEVLSGLVAIFGKSLPQVALFTRLMQLGYSGGQRGRVSSARQALALSRWFTLHVPTEKEAGLRAWLIYSEIKKTTGSRVVMSAFRALAPYPSYLAAVWVDLKKMMADPAFRRSCDDISRRTRALLNGLPVRDHRKLAKSISPAQWRDIEETVDGFVRVLPLYVLFSAVWERSLRSYGVGARGAA